MSIWNLLLTQDFNEYWWLKNNYTVAQNTFWSRLYIRWLGNTPSNFKRSTVEETSFVFSEYLYYPLAHMRYFLGFGSGVRRIHGIFYPMGFFLPLDSELFNFSSSDGFGLLSTNVDFNFFSLLTMGNLMTLSCILLLSLVWWVLMRTVRVVLNYLVQFYHSRIGTFSFINLWHYFWLRLWFMMAVDPEDDVTSLTSFQAFLLMIAKGGTYAYNYLFGPFALKKITMEVLADVEATFRQFKPSEDLAYLALLEAQIGKDVAPVQWLTTNIPTLLAADANFLVRQVKKGEMTPVEVYHFFLDLEIPLINATTRIVNTYKAALPQYNKLYQQLQDFIYILSKDSYFYNYLILAFPAAADNLIKQRDSGQPVELTTQFCYQLAFFYLNLFLLLGQLYYLKCHLVFWSNYRLFLINVVVPRYNYLGSLLYDYSPSPEYVSNGAKFRYSQWINVMRYCVFVYGVLLIFSWFDLTIFSFQTGFMDFNDGDVVFMMPPPLLAVGAKEVLKTGAGQVIEAAFVGAGADPQLAKTASKGMVKMGDDFLTSKVKPAVNAAKTVSLDASPPNPTVVQTVKSIFSKPPAGVVVPESGNLWQNLKSKAQIAQQHEVFKEQQRLKLVDEAARERVGLGSRKVVLESVLAPDPNAYAYAVSSKGIIYPVNPERKVGKSLPYIDQDYEVVVVKQSKTVFSSSKSSFGVGDW